MSNLVICRAGLKCPGFGSALQARARENFELGPGRRLGLGSGLSLGFVFWEMSRTTTMGGGSLLQGGSQCEKEGCKELLGEVETKSCCRRRTLIILAFPFQQYL